MPRARTVALCGPVAGVLSRLAVAGRRLDAGQLRVIEQRAPDILILQRLNGERRARLAGEMLGCGHAAVPAGDGAVRVPGHVRVPARVDRGGADGDIAGGDKAGWVEHAARDAARVLGGGG